MATRATYQFKETGVNVTFYCHWDGYPMGAAQRFRAALAFRPEHPNYRLCDQFARAVVDAEHTPSHESHGDTEYRYTVESKGDGFRAPTGHVITVTMRRYIDVKTDRWDVVDHCPLTEWVDRECARWDKHVADMEARNQTVPR